MTAVPYTRGLNQIGHDCYAWFEPPGSWGLSNSGILVAGDEVLIVDTQNDMPRARALRNAAQHVGHDREVTTVVNTHSDGDHWFGNLMFPQARIFATPEAAADIEKNDRDPRHLREAAAASGPALRDFLNWRATIFDYTDWEPVPPTDTFATQTSVTVGDTQVDLIPVGPAHTTGDAIVHVPERNIVFAGDILFHRSTPIIWAGPVTNCIAACETILALKPAVILPGHGPLVPPTGVRDVRDYLSMVFGYASARFAAGDTPMEAFYQINLGEYRLWAHSSRVYVTILAVYRELDPQRWPLSFADSMETVLGNDAY